MSLEPPPRSRASPRRTAEHSFRQSKPRARRRRVRNQEAMDTSFAVLEGVSALRRGAQRRLTWPARQQPPLADLAKSTPPDACETAALAASQPLLRGKEQAFNRTARCRSTSDELQLLEEHALDFVARVTERQHRRDLAGMTGRAEAFDDDIGGR